MAILEYEQKTFSTDYERIFRAWAIENLKNWKTAKVASYEIFIDVVKQKVVFTWMEGHERNSVSDAGHHNCWRCGGTPILLEWMCEDYQAEFIKCDRCGIRGPDGGDEKEAWRLWDTWDDNS